MGTTVRTSLHRRIVIIIIGPGWVENLKYLSGTGVCSQNKKLSGAGVPPMEKKKQGHLGFKGQCVKGGGGYIVRIGRSGYYGGGVNIQGFS